jgi:hypothetical protein
MVTSADARAARLVGALNAVQTQLAQIEAENTISRRRVRELELELEECKADVARERTRVLEREDTLLRQRERVARQEADAGDRRYQQVVEEKKGKALGALCDARALTRRSARGAHRHAALAPRTPHGRALGAQGASAGAA